jgi:hypothetical protein
LDLLLVHTLHCDEVISQSLYARNLFGDQFLRKFPSSRCFDLGLIQYGQLLPIPQLVPDILNRICVGRKLFDNNDLLTI